jgi:hypothetical protein
VYLSQHFDYIVVVGVEMQRKKRIGVPIERHAEAIYTRAMHEKFYNELYESGAYAIKDREGEDRFVLMHTKEMGQEDGREFNVTLQGDDKIECECGMYEHMGMLRRHALKVYVFLNALLLTI